MSLWLRLLIVVAAIVTGRARLRGDREGPDDEDTRSLASAPGNASRWKPSGGGPAFAWNGGVGPVELTITLGNRTANYTSWQLADAKRWCQYVRTTKEPDILLYNRLSKCGSTTMKMLFDKMAEDNDVVSFAVPKDYWHDLDEDTTMRKSLVGEIMHHVKKSKGRPVIADGHWFQTRFNSRGDFEGKTFENIQLLRECKSRRHSKFLYGLLDNHENKVRQEKGGKAAVDSYREEYLRSKLPLDDCLKDYNCLRGSTKFNHNDTEIIFLCGSQCYADFKKGRSPAGRPTPAIADVTIAADINAHDPEIFSVIGVLDFLGEYIEMLECTYPIMLKGIFSAYSHDQTHGKTGSAAEVYTEAMTKILGEACDPRWNGFVPLFNKIKDSMIRRYLYMKKNRATCCRAGDSAEASPASVARARRFLLALKDFIEQA